MMRNKTYKNVLTLTRIIQAKGYTLEEANDLAINCFEQANSFGLGAEAIADRIINKEQWEEEQKMYRFIK